MKIKNLITIINSIFLIMLSINVVANQTEDSLNNQLRDLILEVDDNFVELYDIEPLDHDQLKDRSINHIVRRHQNNKILDDLKRQDEIKSFLKKNYNK